MSLQGSRWLEVRIGAPPAADGPGVVADLLVDLGARGAFEADGWVVAHFEEPVDPEAFVDLVRSVTAQALGEAPAIEHGWQANEDWAETWKRGLELRRITDRIVVRPSWVEPEGVGPDDVEIVIDPGMAFGTAEHGTTRGCLRLLDGRVQPGERVLDIGAGSGILSIAAARLGADSVLAIEGDPLAWEALRENTQANGAGDRVVVEEAWATAGSIAAQAPVEGVIANIERVLLEPLYEGIAMAVRPGGWVILSGILDTEVDRVLKDLRAVGLTCERVDADEMWRSLLLTRVVDAHA